MIDPPKNPVIRGAKVWLRPLTLDDTVHWAQGTLDQEIASLAGFPIPETPEFSRSQFESKLLKQHGENSFFFVICPLGTSDVVGMIGLHSIDYRNGRAEFGITIFDAAQRGQGYGSDAINAVLDFGFGELPLERIRLQVWSFNERAFDLYQRMGFVHEGTLRRAWRHRGQLHDVHLMAMLRHEWEALPRPKAWDYEPLK